MGTGIRWGRVCPDIKAKNIVIVGGGKSLAGFDFNRLRRDDYFIITVNDSVKGVPFANVWFTLDPWGLNGPQLPPSPFNGKMYAAVPQDYGRRDAKNPKHQVTPDKRVIFLHRLISHNISDMSSETAFSLTLSEDPRCIATGNSGYGAFNIAYLLKPKKILLLGIDGTIGYYYTSKETNRPLTYLPKMFNSTKKQIDDAGIQVINGSEKSMITTYPRYNINKALEIFDAN